MKGYGNFINGKDDFEGKEYQIRSPIDGSIITTGIMGGPEQTRRAIDVAYDAFPKWEKFTLSSRRKILEKLVEIFEERSEEYAVLESRNTGKTMRQSTFMDVNIAAQHIRYFSQTKVFKEKRKIIHPEFPGSYGIVENVPMGVVGAISPWNVPLLMAIWKIVPAILAGNTVVLKPSHYTPLTTFELARDFTKAGLPDGVLNVVNGEGHVVGKELAQSTKIRGLSFTGSTRTGKEVSRNASGTIKKVVMELGGKSPNIVMGDADIEKAAKGIMFGIFLHSGQLCESGSRLMVHKSVKEKLLSTLSGYMEKMRPGNPMDMETDISAITTEDQKRKIEGMVGKAFSEGARADYRKKVKGSVPEGGYYVDPMIMTGISEDMEISREEVFGPVLAVTEFNSEREALDMANNSEYGLAAGIWSEDYRKALRFAGNLKAGTVWINDYHLISAAAPRGGFKNSGIGRELGAEGIYEFTESRHIFVSDKENDLLEMSFGLVNSGD